MKKKPYNPHDDGFFHVVTPIRRIIFIQWIVIVALVAYILVTSRS